eukprot:15326011-Ditylum_brightwellii.AAC.1
MISTGRNVHGNNGQNGGTHLKCDTDSTGLGRWSYVKVAGRDQKQVVITTSYRPCIQHNPGNRTVTA